MIIIKILWVMQFLIKLKTFILKELQLGEIWDFDENKFINEGKLFEVSNCEKVHHSNL